VKFTLIYQGPLKAKSGGDKSRTLHEHEIRKIMHRQLKELWKIQYPLPGLSTGLASHIAGPGRNAQTLVAKLCVHKGAFKFVPLISNQTGLVCRLDIQFLRRSAPGEIVKHGGDLDNRLKTLFDALRIPDSVGDDVQPENSEMPFFYCLLQDDALIIEVNVSTDILLEPAEIVDPANPPAEATGTPEPHFRGKHNVHLIIRVETLVSDPQKADNWSLR
jgi:hypothetical protein